MTLRWRRRSPDERLKLALVKHIERDFPPHWSHGVARMRVINIRSEFTDRGVRVSVDLESQ